ncbi:hypothetical protein BJQ94_11265 [Cryobacterium sp. SO2]|uniref:hypothetical protein n=1 Tax=Cryobacterium sp. SO2 TaxID=1897060 RepID=UPI00223E1121|nr:hypothetical protein [Cryobacterium sp. SO2]WEO75955.1 hypothetical protein BJQ94_11265 [Cryobacterium sp. SO2]
MEARSDAPARSSSRSRAEIAAEQIAEVARVAGGGVRLGSREEMRALCGVSVGTLHEALRLLQSTGEIFVRTGPGGGVFAGESSALSGLVRSIHGQVFDAPLYPQTARVLGALRPLIFADAIGSMNDTGAARLGERVSALEAARDGELRDLVRSSLEVFATIVSIPPPGILKTVAASILRAQMDTLRELSGQIGSEWRATADEHIEAVSNMVRAIVDADLTRALAYASDPPFMGLFEKIADRSATGSR